MSRIMVTADDCQQYADALRDNLGDAMAADMIAAAGVTIRELERLLAEAHAEGHNLHAKMREMATPVSAIRATEKVLAGLKSFDEELFDLCRRDNYAEIYKVISARIAWVDNHTITEKK